MTTLTKLSHDTSLTLKILRFLPHKDLLSLSKTCTRFESLIFSLKALWINVDFTGHPMELQETWKMMKYLHHGTTTLAFEGLPFSQDRHINISKALIKKIGSKCPNLKVLQLKGFIIPSDLNVSLFPSSLTTMVINGCSFRGWRPNFFKDTQLHMPLLEKIEYSGVGEDRIFSLEYFKDLPNLKELTIRRTFLNEVFPHGFPALKKLDILDTEIIGNFFNGVWTRQWQVPPANLLGRLVELHACICIEELNLWFGRFDLSGSSIEKMTIQSRIRRPQEVPFDYISKGCPNLKCLKLIGMWKVNGNEIEDFKKKYRDSVDVVLGV